MAIMHPARTGEHSASLIHRPPLSDRELAARRANAQRSTGPRTERGKARSRLNALKHGGRSTRMAGYLEKLGIDPRGLYFLSRVIRLPGETGDPIMSAIFEPWLRQECMGDEKSNSQENLYKRTGQHP